MAFSIPDKLFFKIGEVSHITGLEPYILRYWESEFPLLKPEKNKAGQRLYTKNDIELVNKIKTLLYDDKYTIEGARKFLVGNKRMHTKKETHGKGNERALRDCLIEVKKELEDLLGKIEKKSGD